MRLSTSTCDLRNAAWGADESIRLLAQSQFRYLNVYLSGANERLNGEDWDEKTERIRTAAMDSGMRLVLAHAVCGNTDMDYDKLVEETARSVAACERLGISDIVVHPLYHHSLSARGVYELNKRFYQDIYSLCPGTDVHILAENAADGEVSGSAFSSGADLMEFLEYAGDARLGVCWDTAHCALNRPPRDNQYDNMIVLGKRLRALHVSDNFADGKHWHSFPYNGVINFDSIICGLIDAGYEGYFNFEASYIVRDSTQLPAWRKAWTHPTRPDEGKRLMEPPVSLKLMAENLLYETGKYMLEQYGVFEE